MSYGIKNIVRFKDTHGVLWTIPISKDGHNDSLVELIPSGNPLMLEFLSDSDDIFSTIHESRANINVIAETNFAFDDLYTTEDLEYKVDIYQGDNLVTDWTNQVASPYETYTESGLDLELVNNSANGGADSNLFALTSGDKVTVFFKLTKNSGDLNALLSLTNEAWTIEDQETLAEGWNILTLTAGWTGNSKFIFWSYGNTDFEIESFFAIKSSALYWTGYLVADYGEEPYEQPPYPVLLKATDGLDYLKNYQYDDDGEYYTGRRLESQIILDILGKIGYNSFNEYINLYENGMNTGVADSPLDQIYIDSELFKDMNCYEVLEEVLKKYGASIRQWAGQFCLYRPVEFDGATVYGRVFTDSVTKTGTSITTAQYIKRTGSATNYIQVSGGTKMMQSPIAEIDIIQDYGYKDSWIKNWQLVRNKELTSPDFDFWEEDETYYVPTGLAGESEGVFILSTALVQNRHIYQTFGYYGKSTSNDITFSFDYLTYSPTAGTLQIRIMVKSNTDSKYLYNYDELELKWNSSTDFIDVVVSDMIKGKSDWRTYSCSILDGLPSDGNYTIAIYIPNSDETGSIVGIKNIKFNETSDNLQALRFKKPTFWETWFKFPFHTEKWWKKNFVHERFAGFKELIGEDTEEVVYREYIKTNPVTGGKINYKFILGDDTNSSIDNKLEQFKGTLSLVTRDSLTNAASDFVTAHAGAYATGGVTVTSSDEDIIFTAAVAGTDFTGSTTITNTSGNLTGTVENTTANVNAVAREDLVELTGTSGTANITCNGLTKLATFGDDLIDSAADFVTSWAADYLAVDVVVTSSGPYVTFTASTPGTDFTSDPTTIANVSGDLSGDVTTTSENVVPVARVDTIALSGLSGAANILCDGVTRAVDIDETLAATDEWNTRGGSEATEVIDLVGDEMKAQYARSKHFIQMMMREDDTYGSLSSFSMLKNLQDSVNTFSGNNRKFIPLAAEFNVIDRFWNIDKIEIL